MKVKRIVLITGNAGKMEEFKSLIGLEELQFGYQSLDLQEIQSLDIREIGEFKTRMALVEKDLFCEYDAVLTDDTALYCDGLNGLPGPLIKWFLKSLKKEGLVDLLQGRKASGSVSCLLSLGIIETGEIIQFEGKVNGRFVQPRGDYGFGWDPVFMPDGHTITYGEMGPEIKNGISHRAEAVKQFRQWLLE